MKRKKNDNIKIRLVVIGVISLLVGIALAPGISSTELSRTVAKDDSPLTLMNLGMHLDIYSLYLLSILCAVQTMIRI